MADQICFECGGTGQIDEEALWQEGKGPTKMCPVCFGSGRIEVKEEQPS